MSYKSFTTTAQIRANSIVSYKRCDNPTPKTEEQREKAKENLLQNREVLNNVEKYQYNGEINKTAQKKLRRIIDNWYTTLKYQPNGKKRKSSERRKLSFVTLTLSAEQEHSDKEIKRELLNHFIIKIKREFNVKNYVWKAELQMNGNVHFHLVIDSYIHYKKIQNIWNNLQEKLGYISKFEAKHGHRDPNSTDVRAVKTSKLVGIYISKYITKREKKKVKKGVRSRLKRFNKLKGKLNARFSVEKESVEKESRKLKGRVWGANDELKKLVFFEVFECVEISENWSSHWQENEMFYKTLERLKSKGYKELFINEWCTIYIFDFNIGKYFGNEYSNFYKKKFDDLYN